MSQIQIEEVIHKAYSGELDLQSKEVKFAVDLVIDKLDKGELRVCSKESGAWNNHAWIKEAILLYFKLQPFKNMSAGDLHFYDKIPLKTFTPEMGVRVVPHAVVRKGAFVHSGTILMPSYINIGAYVDEGTLVDTWATVGSCAQIGKHVHLSGGAGIGGVLEPLQASPVIIEDHVFVGSRCIIVEGAHIEESAVLAAGVTITSNTKILDVTEKKAKEYRGRVPKNSVVIPGSVPKKFNAGTFETQCALIIGERTESTDKKTSLNQVLREFEIS